MYKSHIYVKFCFFFKTTMRFSDHLKAFDVQATNILKAYEEIWDTQISELAAVVIARLQDALEPIVLHTIRTNAKSQQKFICDFFSDTEREQYADTLRHMYRSVPTTQVFMTHILNHFNQNGFSVMWATTEPTKLTIAWTIDSVRHIFVNML